MHTEKFKGYKDWQPELLIKQGIQDLKPYLIKFPTPPPMEEFINFGLPAKDQFFVREEMPDWVYRLNRMKREEALKTANSNHYMAEWIDTQWRKRNEGVWMYINGTPHYIPGKAWWYWNYYYQNTERGIDLGDFRYDDLEWFWIWCLFILPNPNIYGLVDFTLRRDGKSARALGEDLEECTKSANVMCGLQSKTNEDARDTFRDFVVEPWRRLPWYFSPKFDNKTYPAKEINFRSASTSGEDLDASVLASATADELGSSIEVRATVKNAFDGRKLRRYTLDEGGKIDEMDAYEAWRTHKQCLRIGQKLVGKAKITTTVEQLTRYGMEPFFKTWDESDRNKLTKLNQTISGLVPLFKPAGDAYIRDQYGYPIVGTPTPQQAEYRKSVLLKEGRTWEVEQGFHNLGGKELLEMESSSLTGKDRQDFLRMYPPSIAVARRVDSKFCSFPNHIEIINDRLEELRLGVDDVYVGNLDWKDDVIDKEVVWVPCRHNRRDGSSYGNECPICRFRFFTMDFLPYTNRNFYDGNGYLMPGNKGKGLVSADVFKYANTASKDGSKAASHGYMEYDPTIDEGRDHRDQVTDDFIFEYLFRTRTTDDFCEDMCKVCFWLGFEIFPEINLADVWNHFLRRGYEKFLKYQKLLKKGTDGRFYVEESKTPGTITLGEQSKNPKFAAVESYLDRNGYKCNAIKFLQDCRDVEFEKLTKFDAFVSGSQCLFGRTSVTRYKPTQKKVSKGLDGMLDLRRAGT